MPYNLKRTIPQMQHYILVQSMQLFFIFPKLTHVSKHGDFSAGP